MTFISPPATPSPNIILIFTNHIWIPDSQRFLILLARFYGYKLSSRISTQSNLGSSSKIQIQHLITNRCQIKEAWPSLKKRFSIFKWASNGIIMQIRQVNFKNHSLSSNQSMRRNRWEAIKPFCVIATNATVIWWWQASLANA